MNRIIIPILELLEMNSLLAQQKRVENQPKNVIREYSTKFADGFEAVIKVVNGNDGSGPYVDPVLFRDGHELGPLEVRDRLDGFYKFQFAKREPFCVTVTGIAKLVVACANANGEPDFFFVKCIGDEQAFDDGDVHGFARREAEREGYEGTDLVYDEAGPYASSFMDLFEWDTATALESVVQLPSGHDWKEIPSGAAQCFAWRCEKCKATFAHDAESHETTNNAEADVCEKPKK